VIAAAGGIAGLVVIVGVIAVIHLLSLEASLRSLPAVIRQAELDAENGQLGAAQSQLALAQSRLVHTNNELYNSPDFSIIDVFPIAHQNLHAIRSATMLALRMVGGGQQILHAAAPLESTDGRLEVPLHAGRIPLSVTEAVDTALNQVATDLPTSPQPPSSPFLVGRVRSAVAPIYRVAAQRRDELTSVARALNLIDDIAGGNGDRRYLIAVANSAEMRGTGGMILSYGILQSSGGHVSLTHMGDIDELKLSNPEAQVPFPADFAKTYADLGPNENWRNVNMLPEFTVDAPVMEAMFHQATGQNVDGVIQVDSSGLAAILQGIGPVSTPDLGPVTAQNVVPLTLSTAYSEFPDRQARQDYTEEAAKATFTKLVTGAFSGLRPLGSALLTAGSEGHVLMYASDPADEAILTELGFAGRLPRPGAPVAELTVQNFGGDKLDYYVHTSLAITGSKPAVRGTEVTARISLTNDAPSGRSTPRYVFGPLSGTGPPGVYLGLVTLYLPAGSYLKSSQVDGSIAVDPAQGTQDGLRTISYVVSVPAGGSSTATLQIFVPPTGSRSGSFVFVTPPRVWPTEYRQSVS
jgi:hypothetical protein